MARVKVPAYAVVGATQTIYTIDGKVLTGVGVAIPLGDLADYARGSIIRGGAADWEAYDAKTDGSVLVGDGTDLVSTVNPTLTGTLTLPNAGLHLLDTNASHDLIIAPGSDLTADRTLTLTTGDAARTITLTGNPTLADWFDQSVKVAASPTLADVFVPDGGTFGISGNELLTFDTAGIINVSGALFGINEAAPGAQLHTTSSGAAVIGQIVKGAVGQIANLTEWQNPAGNSLGKFDAVGQFSLNFGGAVRTADSKGIYVLLNQSAGARAYGLSFLVVSHGTITWVQGVQGKTSARNASGTATVSVLIGGEFANDSSTSGTATVNVTYAAGVRVAPTTWGAAAGTTNITNSYGVDIGNQGNIQAGTVNLTNVYGLRIADQTNGSVLNYAIYTNAGLVRFGDNVGFNTTPDRRIHARETSASIDTIIPIARFESEVSGGVGAAGHGVGVEFYGESSTTTNQAMGLIAARWSVATHASRRSRLEFRTWYIGNEVLVGVVEAPVNASVDGNARGVGAVDWQGHRTAATQVAGSAAYAVISGGAENTASGEFSVVAGGSGNTASGDIATVSGGSSCLASGDNTFAVGWDAHATHDHSFVLSATAAQTISWAANTFTTRCHGGARFYSAAGVATGVQLTAGGNAWAGISDRNVKENFRPVTGILDKIALLPIYDYNLKAQSADVRHIGPVSQDFNPLFGFSEAPLRINMLDIASVGLAGVQALHVEVLALRKRVLVLEAQLVD